MKTNVRKSKRSQVVAPQQPETTQLSVAQQTNTSQEPAAQQAHDISRPKQVPTVTPTPQDIAERAYQIYLQMDCQQGQNEQNWLQAEQELKNRIKI